MTWTELPAKLKIYIVSLTIIALPITIWACWIVLTSQPSLVWSVLTLFTLITALGFQYLRSANTIVGISDAIIMAIAMIYGTAYCIVTTLFFTILICIFVRNPQRIPIYKITFNTSSAIFAAWIYSSVYDYFHHSGIGIADIFIPALLMVIAFFIINTLLTSTAIAWSTGSSIASCWAKRIMPSAIDFPLSAAAATIIVTTRQFSDYMPFLAAPLIVVIWGWHKVNKDKKIEAEKHLEEQEALYLRTVESLALAVDAKDQTTYGHIRRVRVYATRLAHFCGIKDPDELKAIETGALLHDIGKLAIDDYILNKPGKLSKLEFDKIKMHSTAGDEILKQIRFPFPVAKYVRYHHERYDGTGYPDGLKEEAIPLGARILTIADAYDAIRFSRPYKLPVSSSEAVEILQEQSGTAFDPELVRLFVNHIDELEHEAEIASANIEELSFRKYFENVDRELSNADTTANNNGFCQDIPTELLRIAEFCSTAIGHLEFQDFLPIIARHIQSLVPFSTCAFYLNDDTGYVRIEYVCGAFSDLLQGHRIGMGKGISGWVAAHRRAMVNTDPLLEFHGIKGDFSCFTDTMIVPLISDETMLGTISLYAQDPISYNQSDLSLLQTLSASLAPMVSEAKKRIGTKPEDIIDPTTRIHRISYLTAVGPQVISAAARKQSPVCLIYLEIRNLYQIIRIYGGNVGNTILQRIANCIKTELRETDILVRYGHQGFVALLPGVRIEHARRCVLRLKHQIRSEVSTVGGQNFSIDCSAGISICPKDGTSISSLLQSAQDSQKINISESALSDGNVVDFLPRA
jgi:diguanylate cyclase (GGDEF)-like protein/putative nucleotidyltransferase with HDIG domain